MRRLIYLFFLQCLIFCCQYDSSSASPLVGSKVRPAKKNEFAAVVSIGYKDNGPHLPHFCTGTLITKKHVLTSSHCLINETINDLQVTVGSIDQLAGKKHALSSWITYDEWVEKLGYNSEFPENDIAILTLKEPVNDPNIKPATLSKVPKRKLPGTTAVVAGWGVANDNKIPRYMETVTVDVIKLSECTDILRKLSNTRAVVQTNYICTNAKPYALIQFGDSGGPLFSKNNELIGVNDSTSPKFKNPRDPTLLNLHASVDYYKDFIQDVISS